MYFCISKRLRILRSNCRAWPKMLHYDVMKNGAISADVVESCSTTAVNSGFKHLVWSPQSLRGSFIGKSPRKGLAAVAFLERHDCNRFDGSARDIRDPSFHVRISPRLLRNNSRLQDLLMRASPFSCVRKSCIELLDLVTITWRIEDCNFNGSTMIGASHRALDFVQ